MNLAQQEIIIFDGLDNGPPGIIPGSLFDLNFSTGLYYGTTLGGLTVSRASANATDLLATDVSGRAYNSFGANVARVTAGRGLLVEEARTNVLLASAVPATQTSPSLGTGTYSLWCNGAGSVTPSGVTATITGAAAATNGAPNTFVVTVAGTVLFTVSGALNAFQCELNPGTIGNPTSFITTTVAAGTRNMDIVKKAISLSSPYSILGIGTPNSPVTFASQQYLVEVNDTTGSNRMALKRDAVDALPWFVSVLATVVNINNAIGGAAAWAKGVQNKIAGYGVTGFQRASYNTVEDTSSYAFSPATPLTQLNIGSTATLNNLWNGYISRIVISPLSLLGA